MPEHIAIHLRPANVGQRIFINRKFGQSELDVDSYLLFSP